MRGQGMPPENTVEAFERAIADGADGVELDVRLTRDGHVVVLHDPTLARVAGDPRGVHAIDLASLPRLAGGQRIPTLADALDACRGRIVNVELKSDVPDRRSLARAAVRVVRAAPRSTIVWSSFHPMLVLATAVLDPRSERAILVGGRTRRLGTALPLAMRRMVTAAHLEDAIATAPRLARLARAGLRLVAWTVNDPARARALVRDGIAWIITDRPAE
ncbi:MAG TPA: glycerophosphodiester phosphodiesterase, partial [Labilithrix sp.]